MDHLEMFVTSPSGKTARVRSVATASRLLAAGKASTWTVDGHTYQANPGETAPHIAQRVMDDVAVRGRTQRNILNLTPRRATQDQIRAGVIDLPRNIREHLQSLLSNFTRLPSSEEVDAAASLIANVAEQYNKKASAALIDCAPFLAAPLTRHLRTNGFRVLFAFSERVPHEARNTDNTEGSDRNVDVIQHLGFVEVS